MRLRCDLLVQVLNHRGAGHAQLSSRFFLGQMFSIYVGLKLLLHLSAELSFNWCWLSLAFLSWQRPPGLFVSLFCLTAFLLSSKLTLSFSILYHCCPKQDRVVMSVIDTEGFRS